MFKRYILVTSHLELETMKVVSDFLLTEDFTNAVSVDIWIECKCPGAEQELSKLNLINK